MKKTRYNKTIVALLDTSCGSDSYNIFWNNDDEIPNNQIDDDKNGYIDDLHGWDFVNNSSNIATNNWKLHGNCMLNIIQSEYADVMILRILNDEEYGTVEDIIDAIKYAEENGARICNLSFITFVDSSELEKVMKESTMLFVVSAGNYGENLNISGDSYPVCYQLPNMITVASCDVEGRIISESNYGDKYVDVAAVSDNVKINLSNGESVILGGTSVAAAYVTKVASYILCCSADEISSEELKKKICSTVIVNQNDNGMLRYKGMVDLEHSLKCIRSD